MSASEVPRFVDLSWVLGENQNSHLGNHGVEFVDITRCEDTGSGPYYADVLRDKTGNLALEIYRQGTEPEYLPVYDHKVYESILMQMEASKNMKHFLCHLLVMVCPTTVGGKRANTQS